MRAVAAGLISFLVLSAAETVQAASNAVTIREEKGYRMIESNGIPDHSPGQFPNRGNPNTISPQSYSFRMPLEPVFSSQTFEYGHDLFGVALNGVPFDPETAEFWNNDRSSGWNYDALSGKINLGIDTHHAHVQPTGAYHYHGVPAALIRKSGGRNPVLAGYATDGFPVYYEPGVRPSWRLKQGTRLSGPGGRYDGTYVQDYEYAAGTGDLDECNGRVSTTAEYPAGIYHYDLTEAFPFVPRCLHGKADPSFEKAHPHTQGAGGQERRGPPGGGRKAPAEAVAACSGKGEGSSCSFNAPRGRVTGTCRKIPEGTACVPSGPPPF